MIYKEITVTKRFCTGEFEFDEIKVVVEVETFDKDHAANAIRKALDEIIESRKEKEEEEENANTSSYKNTNKNGKSSTKGAKKSDDEGSDDDEGADAEAGDDDNDPAEADEDQDGDEAEEEEQEEKPVKGKGAKGKSDKSEGKKTFKKKPQTYNRSIEQHKEIFGGVVRSINPKWKDNDVTKKKVKKASEGLEGEDFLDENGEVLENFKAKVKKLIK